MLRTWPWAAARIRFGVSAALTATRKGIPLRPFGEELGEAVAAAIIDLGPGPGEEEVVGADPGELGVADDMGRVGIEDDARLDDPALDQDRVLARYLRAVGGRVDVGALVAAGGGELDRALKALAGHGQGADERPGGSAARPGR